jgi:O-antigen/teichoic acid export membrane protein
LGIKKNIGASLAYQIGIALLNFLVSLFIARLFGANGRGDLAIYNSAVAIGVTTFGISISSAMVYFIASKKISLQESYSVLIFASIGAFLLLCILCLCIYVAGFSSVIAPFANGNMLLFFYVAHVVFTITTINLTAILNAQEEFVFPLQLQFAQVLLLITLVVCIYNNVFINYKPTAADVVIIIVILYSIQTFILLGYTIYFCKIALLKINFNFKIIRQLFAFSALAFACNALQMISYRIDLFFLQYYHTATIVGVYSIAVMCIQMLWILPTQFATVFYTKFNQRQQSKNTIYFVANMVAISFWACFIIFGIAYLIGIYGIPFLFGNGFADSAKLVGILLIGAIPIASALMISTYNASANLLQTNLKGSAIGLVFCILFNFLLIPKYGYYGAAFASAIAYLSNCIYLYINFCTVNKIAIKNLFLPNMQYLKNVKSNWNEL